MNTKGHQPALTTEARKTRRPIGRKRFLSLRSPRLPDESRFYLAALCAFFGEGKKHEQK
jgi:hypothetical protein